MFKFVSHSRHSTYYTSFFLYVFELSDETKGYSTNDILEKFIAHPYFRDQHDWGKEKSEKSFLHTAFVIENLAVENFKKTIGKDVENIVLSCLDRDDWKQADSSVREDYRETFNKSKFFTDELNIEKDEMFYLNMDWFIESEKLVEPHWIWDYALTFIFVNPGKNRLIMLDYGMD